MDPKTTQNSNGNNKKTERKHEEKKKMNENGNHDDATDGTVEEVCRQMNKLVDDGSRGGSAGSGSSNEGEDLVNAINYNTITSLAALKDILQGDGSDTPETDSFFQHYFMNHCNNLSSRNSVTGSPFPFPERRRLSQCMEEDEDDERKESDPPPSMVSSENASHGSLSVKEAEPSEAGEGLQTDPCEPSGSKRTVMGASHKFLVTTAKPPASPVERALRSQVHNSHTVHFGTKGAEEQRPSVRSIFAGQNLHRDKHYFDSSLVEIRSIVDDTTTSSEDIWVKRADVKPVKPPIEEVRKSSIEAEKKKLKAEAEILDQATAVRPRAGTWSSQTAKKELDSAKKAKKDKESTKKDSGDRRQKRDHRLDVAITRSTQSVGERRRRGSADDGQAHQMYQQTIHGTSGVSRRPALFDIFKSKQRGDPKGKQPSIMKQVKAAVQNITKSGTPVKDPSKVEGKPLDAESVTTPPPDKARDGSAHPHPGSDTRYYHTVTASATRRPSAMAKVMDIFRGKPFSPGQTIHSESGERRKARAIAQLQHQYASGAHLRRAASQEAEKRRSSLGNVPQMRHRASDAFLDPHHAAMLFRDSRGLPVADPFLEKVSLSDLEKEAECMSVNTGSMPLSEEETKGAAQLLSVLGPKLMAFINLRGFANIITVPYAFTRDYCSNYPVLMEILESVHTILHKKFNVTYDYGNTGSIMYNLTGNVADWVKKELNVPLVYTVYMKYEDEILQHISHVQPLSEQFAFLLEGLLTEAQDIYGPLFDCSRKNEVDLAILVPFIFLFSDNIIQI